MQIFDKKKIGKRTYTVSGEGSNLFECSYDLSKLSFDDVDECGICHSDNLILNARIAGKKKFEYVEIKCLDCRATVVFGKMMENPDVFFLRKTADKKLDWKQFNINNNHETEADSSVLNLEN